MATLFVFGWWDDPSRIIETFFTGEFSIVLDLERTRCRTLSGTMASHGLFRIETTGSGQLDIDGTVTSSNGAVDIDSTGVLPSRVQPQLLESSSEATATIDAQGGALTIDSAGTTTLVTSQASGDITGQF